MIDQMDRFIKTWLEGLVPEFDVVFQRPADAPDKTILVRLMDATPTLPPRDTRVPVMQIALCYLIMVYHSDPEVQHRVLAELIFSAMQNSAFEVDVEPVPLALWGLLGHEPQPSFRIRPSIRLERPRRPVHPVLHPLQVHITAGNELHGMVRGPRDQPMMDATIECPDLGLYTRTGPDGRFQLPLVPGSDADLTLLITAKGIEHTITARAGKHASYSDPLIVQIDPVETPVEG